MQLFLIDLNWELNLGGLVFGQKDDKWKLENCGKDLNVVDNGGDKFLVMLLWVKNWLKMVLEVFVDLLVEEQEEILKVLD